MARVLIVEDEKRLLRNLRDGLAEEGFEPVTSTNGEAALLIAETQPVDLVILDLMLPGLHGFEVLRRMRLSGMSRPVLILTASEGVDDRVRGLNGGADDYLVKPFSYAELLARVKALLRRGPPRDQMELSAGSLKLDLVQRLVFREDEEIPLSRREFDLLAFLVRHQGETVTREMLAREIWRDSQTLLTNVIDVFVNRLRRRIDREGEESIIRTVRGTGYLVPGARS
ncbi:MAG: response regulator transcription factor [Planctomycetaceae bacterium]|nr:response regulator transcription factor [Planctomycetaceae bacterium]